MQARVFELVHADGRPTGKVVKIAHTDLGHKAINAVWISMEREWELVSWERGDCGCLCGFCACRGARPRPSCCPSTCCAGPEAARGAAGA